MTLSHLGVGDSGQRGAAGRTVYTPHVGTAGTPTGRALGTDWAGTGLSWPLEGTRGWEEE